MIRGGNLRATLVGFAGAIVALAVLSLLVGIEDILDALSLADPSVIFVVIAVAVCWLTAWGLSLRTVLGVLGAPITAPIAVLVFAGATFANNVTPFGQAGGEPVSALLVSRASYSEYETGLAAIASVDALNFVPSIVLALIGLGYFATRVTFGENLALVSAIVIGFAIALILAVYFGWTNRYRLERITVDTLTPLARRVGAFVPGLSPPNRAAFERRIEGFFTAIERVGTNPRGLLLALCFSAVGWVGLTMSLWLSLFALGYTVSAAVVLVAIPAGAMAGVTPLPGGLGGVEFVLGVLVTATSSVPLAAVTAAILIHRGATYALPTVVGGTTAAVLADR
jgi:uncharacterized protein (TIRG00374 family)